MKKIKSKKDDPSGYLVPAGIFIGMGFGFLFNQLLPGLFIGIGLGFLGLFISQLLLKKKK